MIKRRVALILVLMLVFSSVMPGFAQTVRVRIEGKDDVLFNKDVEWSGEISVHDILVSALGDDYAFDESQYGPNPSGFNGESKDPASTYWGLYFVKNSHIEAATSGVGGLKIDDSIKELIIPHLSFSSRIGDLDVSVSENGKVNIDAQAIVNTYNSETNGYDYSTQVASKGAITIKNISSGSVVETGLTDENGKYSTELNDGVYDISIITKDSNGNPTLVVDRERIAFGDSYDVILHNIKNEHYSYTPRANYNLQGALNATSDLNYTEIQRTEMYLDFSTRSLSMGGDYLKALSELYSAGIDPTDLNGRNIIAELESKDLTTLTGGLINQAASLLQAINTHDITLSSSAKFTEDQVVEIILNGQGPSGGWTYDGGKDGLDTAGDVLLALAPYYASNANVKSAVDKFVNWVSDIQTANGHIADPSWGESAPTTAKVVIGLVANGVDPEGSQFTKNENTLIDQLKYGYDKEQKGYNDYKGDLDLSYGTPQVVAALSVYKAFNASNKAVRLTDFSNVAMRTVQGVQQDYAVSVTYSVGKTDNATTLEANKELTAHVSMTSLVDRTDDVLLVVGLYDSNDTLVNYAFLSQSMKKDDSKTFHAGFRLPSNVNGHYVKCFVWEGTSLVTPGEVLSSSTKFN